MPKLSSCKSDSSVTGTDIFRCEGFLHDIGKVALDFQRHIRDVYVENKQMTYHARLGGFAVFHALDRMGASSEECLIGMLAVFKHHGRLPNAAERLLTIAKSERGDGKGSRYSVPQIEDIDASEPNRTVADTLLRKASHETASWESFKTAIDDGSLFESIIDCVGKRGHRNGTEEPIPEKLDSQLYDRVLHHWSVLTLADKTCAGGIENDALRPSHLELDGLEDHIDELRSDSDEPPELASNTTPSSLELDVTEKASLNQLREAVRRLVRDNAEQFVDSSADVATLTLPTGLGKTFTGITAAYTIRDALSHTELAAETRPRVVYALPYTSIIEQTREIFEDSAILDADPLSLAFTVHHYLSETVSYPKIENKFDGDQAADDQLFFDPALLGESWRSGTTLTTFVQLFESLVSPTNAGGMKLPSLTNSIIILDEPQTLPKPWWEAIRRLTTLLVEQYNAHVISMTATQPSLFTDAPALESISLLGPSASAEPQLVETCFRAVERVEYSIDASVHSFKTTADELLSVETAAARLYGSATSPMDNPIRGAADGTSVLSVCNTVACTQQLTESVQACANADGREIQRIGSAYRAALHECTPTVTDDLSPDQRPDPEDVAAKTLEQLGFQRVDDGDDSVSLSKQRWAPNSSTGTVFLGTFTSRLRPRDRRAFVAIASVLARAGVPFVFVSTQAVEAGVDISFARVYRDIAPLDSIVQAAGRCNRSFEWGHSAGKVTVWALGAIEGSSVIPATAVYKPKSLLTMVASILTNCSDDCGTGTVPEYVLTRTAIPEFYSQLDVGMLANRELVQWIEQCQAGDLQRATLIDDDYEQYDVIVAETAVEKALLQTLIDSFVNDAVPSRFDLLKSMADLRVSLPVRDIETIRSQVTTLNRAGFTADGISVLTCSAAGEQEVYDVAAGGFIVTKDDGLAGRFTFN
ncbi:CRISPR-associated endonuclease Cas3'' [Halocatena halophila]|uniref:CRISPR-associated endonuclease Cas3'' n=1 Tax=Halocatena halophila TaxID=2814576 RepID=UPI002ED4CBCC